MGATCRLPTRLARGTTGFTRLGFIDRERTASKLGPLKSCNGRLGRLAVRHLHKAKTARATGFTIRHNLNLFHLAIRFEELAEILSRGAECKIANKDVHRRFLME